MKAASTYSMQRHKCRFLKFRRMLSFKLRFARESAARSILNMIYPFFDLDILPHPTGVVISGHQKKKFVVCVRGGYHEVSGIECLF